MPTRKLFPKEMRLHNKNDSPAKQNATPSHSLIQSEKSLWCSAWGDRKRRRIRGKSKTGQEVESENQSCVYRRISAQRLLAFSGARVGSPPCQQTKRLSVPLDTWA